MVHANILPLSVFRLLDTTHDKSVTRQLNVDLVICEISTSACRTDDLHLRGRAVAIDDFDRPANARHFNARARRELVGLVDLLALLKVVPGCGLGSDCPR